MWHNIQNKFSLKYFSFYKNIQMYANVLVKDDIGFVANSNIWCQES